MKELEKLGLRCVELIDERTELAAAAFRLIEETFPRQDRHSIEELRAEVEEKRLGVLTPYDYHLITLVGEDGEVPGVVVGVYLAGVNAGFVDYLVVDGRYRGQRLGHILRDHLAAAFAANARASGRELAAIIGEVRAESPWLLELVRNGRAIPLHLNYFHPALPIGGSTRYILYRQPVADRRTEFPAVEVRQMLYAIYRRAYRVRYPLERENFRAMVDELSSRDPVGAHPEVIRQARVSS